MSFKTIKKQVTTRTAAYKKVATTQLRKNPLLSFVIALALLFGVIVIGDAIRKPEVVEEVAEPAPKQVRTYQIGSVPRVQLQAQVQKSGVITITAQTGGIVRSIPVEEGQTINAGTRVITLASNYAGANAMSVQRQIAGEQYTFNKENYDLQKDLIGQQILTTS